MKKIITAVNNPNLNEELKKENEVEILFKDIQYKEGILEILENKKLKIDYIIIDENLPGEIKLEKLIEKIIEKNEKIKIIITIKKENKNKINLNNKKIIKIYYEKNINLEKLKKYNNNLEEINIRNNKIKINKKDKEKNIYFKTKIITILGERKVGKSVTIINLLDYIIQKMDKTVKTLIIELNEDSPSFYTLFGCEKFNKININEDRRNKKISNIKKYSNEQKYKQKYLSNRIIENLIIKINKNIDLISYNKLINFNFIRNIEKKYNYLFIEIYSKKNKIINKKILNNSNKNILLIRPNLLEIKNAKKIIEKNKLNKNNSLKILINNYNKNSIDENIIKNMLKENKIIGKINYEIEYEKIINTNLKNIKFLSKEYRNNLKRIINNLIM